MVGSVQNKKIKVGVIGAGPAGLTAAYELTKAGTKVEVFESSQSVGGLAKTIKLWNQKVDTGPHRFFSNDTRVNKLWLEVVGNNYKMVDRLTRIFYKNKLFFCYRAKIPFSSLFCNLLTFLYDSFSHKKLSQRSKNLFGSFNFNLLIVL